ncbi:MAG TPA: IclR family transcriptional regulator C-terminal domain-containing protein [Actinomycetota bacterium]|nr:IclR family transcriptional regulator C-terminal domain-containing protein [Actinomycetota bacterium]
MTVSSQARPTEFVQSLERGLAVIRSFSRDRPALTLSEIADLTGLTRAAARRFLITLKDLGYVGSDGRLFSLRPRVLELGYSYLSSLPIWDMAKPHLEDLADKVRETTSASVLDGTDIVFVARVETKRIMAMTLGVGSRLPAWATAMGRVLLADMRPADLDQYFAKVTLKPLSARTVTDEAELRRIIEQARSQGWTLVDQEVEEGVRSLAVPIRSTDGRAAAALTVCSHAFRVSVERVMDEFLPLVLETSKRITEEISAR